MNKQEFLRALEAELCGLPEEELAERLAFYAEMIDDRMEEGYSEEQAVAQIGSAEEVAEQILEQTPLARLIARRIKPQRRMRVWEVLLLVLGAPLWLPLLFAAVAVVLAVYVSVWSVAVSLWACFAALVACVPGGIVSGIVFIALGNVFAGLSIFAAALVCAGLSIFFFFGCKAVTRGTFCLGKGMLLWTKKQFVKKEKSQ